MKLVIDSANIETIRKLNEFLSIDGVTTNPSIIVKEKGDFLPLLKEIRNVIGEEKELFVQAISEKAEEIVEEARYICSTIEGNIVVKVPVTFEGIKAIKMLQAEGIRTLATTIYTPMSALMAAKAGAEYVAPYVNRIDNLTGNGTQVVSDIVDIFSAQNLPCKVLAASFKNVQQIQDVFLSGSHGVTAPPELLKEIFNHPSVERDVKKFRDEWTSQYGLNSNSIISTI